MNNFRKKVFWVFLFAFLVFCCWLYISGQIENQRKTLSQTVFQEKTTSTFPISQTTKISANISSQISTGAPIFSVVRVIDGDTIVVLVGGKNETVRLLGINTPETVDPRKSVECFGPEASEETKSLLNNRQVLLQNDPTQSDRDKYGRLLRYIFRDDGLFVDEYLVKEGFAYEYTYLGASYKYQAEFKADQKNAKLAGLGLWASSTCSGKK
jgi:micrococcal nuclease